MGARNIPSGALRGALAGLSPAYFSLVMATGIVSIAADIEGLRAIAIGLFWVNVAAFGLLALLSAGRMIWYFERMVADVTDHVQAPGFFTLIAGTGVLGSQCIALFGWRHLALGLWGFQTLLWVGLTYGTLAALIVKNAKPDFTQGMTAGWLVAVVATQSVAVLGADLASAFPGHGERLILFACALWLIGWMLYFWISLLIFYRYVFLAVRPGDLLPTSWIIMGALAITTLSGSRLILSAGHSSLVLDLEPFLKGFTLLAWATATWWIPLLVILGVWKYVRRHYPLAYAPLYWGAVFPLGMYTVATHDFALAEGLDGLAQVSRMTVYIALLAWLLTALGMARGLARAYVRSRELASGGSVTESA